ncbi:MAG: phosphatidylserine decarboxylase, partial [Muriicola sp.]|nr:phosphatidylserine decarboxylase [Muriicola sp.]
GKYLVAWHPKSSEENERTTVVIRTPKFGDILYRQIAGAMARRIVNYAEVGESAQQGEESGFIKFGSRVDVFLPTDAQVAVKLNQKVKGAITCIATVKEKDG